MLLTLEPMSGHVEWWIMSRPGQSCLKEKPKHVEDVLSREQQPCAHEEGCWQESWVLFFRTIHHLHTTHKGCSWLCTLGGLLTRGVQMLTQDTIDTVTNTERHRHKTYKIIFSPKWSQGRRQLWTLLELQLKICTQRQIFTHTHKDGYSHTHKDRYSHTHKDR